MYIYICKYIYIYTSPSLSVSLSLVPFLSPSLYIYLYIHMHTHIYIYTENADVTPAHLDVFLCLAAITSCRIISAHFATGHMGWLLSGWMVAS